MTSKKENKHKKLWTFLFVLLNVAVVAYIAFSEFGNGVSRDVAPQLRKYWYLYFLGGIGCVVVLLTAETVKYVYMMMGLGQKVSWRVAFETVALGKYYDCITPSGIGGQPFQIYWLHKHGYSDGASSSITITGFITMQFGFIILAASIFITWRSVELEPIRYTAYAGLLIYSIIPFIIVAFSYKPKAIENMISGILHFGAHLHVIKDPDKTSSIAIDKIREFNVTFKVISRNKKSMLILLALSIAYQLALCSISYFVILAFSQVDYYRHILAATIYIYATASMVATPGNSGASEGVFYIVFSAIGSNGVFWAMLIWRLISYYLFIALGGCVYAFNALTAKRRLKGNAK